MLLYLFCTSACVRACAFTHVCVCVCVCVGTVKVGRLKKLNVSQKNMSEYIHISKTVKWDRKTNDGKSVSLIEEK